MVSRGLPLVGSTNVDSKYIMYNLKYSLRAQWAHGGVVALRLHSWVSNGSRYDKRADVRCVVLQKAPIVQNTGWERYDDIYDFNAVKGLKINTVDKRCDVVGFLLHLGYRKWAVGCLSSSPTRYDHISFEFLWEKGVVLKDISNNHFNSSNIKVMYAHKEALASKLEELLFRMSGMLNEGNGTLEVLDQDRDQ
ncbi:hypothetical protein Tco_0593946 [Tanacetum coccineum]